MHVGEAEVTPLEAEGQGFVVDSQEMKDGGLEVVDVNGILGHVVAKSTGATVNHAGFHSAAGHPHREAARVVIPSEVLVAGLGVGGTAEFSPPDDEGVFKHAAFLEVLEEGGGGTVDRIDLALDGIGDAVVVIPTAIVELDEAHTRLGKATGEKAVGCEGCLSGLGPVALEDALWFPGDIHQPGDRALHAVGQLEGVDAGLDLGVTRLLELELVEGADAVDGLPAVFLRHALRVGEEEDGIAGGLELHALVRAGKKSVMPVAGGDGLATTREKNDESGQVFVGTPQAVAEPGAHAGSARERTPGLQEGDRRVVVDGIGGGAPDQADVVRDLRHVLEEGVHVHAGLAVPGELVLGGHHVDGALSARHGGEALVSPHLGREWFAIPFGQVGLGIKGLQLGRPTRHVEIDDALGPGGEVGEAGQSGSGSGVAGGEELGEGGRTEPTGGTGEEGAAGV